MKIFPAIDIKNGQAVRLFQGDYEQVTVYADAPVDVAKSFRVAGAKNLHVVDLDGALSGGLTNRQTIQSIVSETDAFVEVGGGIRDFEALEGYVATGVDRIILGSIAVESFEFVLSAVRKYSSQIAVGVDAKDGRVAIHGWKTVTDVNAFEFCRKLRDSGVGTVIYTDISKDGTLSGPNFEAYEKLMKIDGLNVIASGGVSVLNDLVRLKGIGVYGAILGKALYAGKIKLEDALRLED